MERGLFIVVEGLDRSGKSTLCRGLHAQLSGELRNFPDRSTPIGQAIDQQLRERRDSPLNAHSLHLLFAANRHELKASMLRTLLEQGSHLILDRYVHSGAAYGMANGLSGDWCLACERSLPRPDVVLFVDVSAELAGARAGFGAEKFEKLPMQTQVYNNFGQLMGRGDCSWVRLNGTLPPPQLCDAALKALEPYFSMSSAPLQYF